MSTRPHGGRPPHGGKPPRQRLRKRANRDQKEERLQDVQAALDAMWKIKPKKRAN